VDTGSKDCILRKGYAECFIEGTCRADLCPWQGNAKINQLSEEGCQRETQVLLLVLTGYCSAGLAYQVKEERKISPERKNNQRTPVLNSIKRKGR